MDDSRLKIVVELFSPIYSLAYLLNESIQLRITVHVHIIPVHGTASLAYKPFILILFYQNYLK